MNFKNLRLILSLSFLPILLSFETRASIPEHWISLLKTMVETNSSSDNPEGLASMRKILIPELQALGFQTRLIDLEHPHQILLADFPNEKPELLLVAHVDTVFPKASLFQKFRVEEKALKGPGVIDMKGGIALMLHVLSELKNTGTQLNKIRVLINDDEEIGSGFSRTKFPELAQGIKSALVFEPGLPNQALVTSHSGVQWLEIVVHGKAAHAGLEHEKGLNACVELANKISKISQLTDYTKKLTVNIGVIQGGIKANVVCEEAKAKIDIRYLDKTDLQRVLAEIRKIVAESSVHNPLLNLSTHSELKFTGDVPSMPREASNPLLVLAKSLSEPLGHTVQGQHVGYGSDGGATCSNRD